MLRIYRSTCAKVTSSSSWVPIGLKRLSLERYHDRLPLRERTCYSIAEASTSEISALESIYTVKRETYMVGFGDIFFLNKLIAQLVQPESEIVLSRLDNK